MELQPSTNKIECDQNFRFSTFIVHLMAIEKVSLPSNMGSTLRGAFGRALKRVACRRSNADCAQCFLSDQCIFFRYFWRTRVRDRHPVRPYVFEVPPSGDMLLEKGDSLSFIFTLIGESITHYREFIAVFEEMGSGGIGKKIHDEPYKKRGRCQLEEVSTLNDDVSYPLYVRSNSHMIRNPPVERIWSEFTEQPDQEIEEICIRFITPTRIQNRGRLIDEIPFHILVNRLCNRILDLDREYCGGSLNFPVQELTEMAEREVEVVSDATDWYDWERYSSTQDERMKLGGIVGEVTYQGNLTPFIPFLLLGEYIHVGKQATFGNGLIKVAAL